ncbi:nucleotidyltransferase domain-containing protein [Planctomicrobium sp. SH664]|uniref:nucleotidyltransferase domain-containing protein n=1 Tax=Planctomicrobium sp. SH664 TaxID=3448125 RepID=UPI003F5C0075
MAEKLVDPDAFTRRALTALPQGIRSIVLFGSAATGDFVAGASDYDLLVVLDSVSVNELAALGPLIQEWHRRGNPLPLLFAADQIQSSVDAFAAEFLEMKQSRRVLHGVDPVAEMEINPAHVRIHLERELKGKLLALRNRYALLSSNARHVVTLLTDSFSTFLSLFRLALRLYQPEVPREKLDALRALATHLTIDLEPFLMVDEVRRNQRRLTGPEVLPLFTRYSLAIESIVQAIDQQIHSAN